MPELPEVETVRRGLAPHMEGLRIERVELRRPNLRFPFPPDFAARLTGRTVLALGRRAKYLLADLDNGEKLLMHLGMSGSFRVELPQASDLPGQFHHPRGRQAVHDHVVLHFEGGGSIVYNDPRRFGFMDLLSADGASGSAHLRNLGEEPLGNLFDGNFLARAFAGKKTPLKAALLDQRLICGLGNIYVCEALHRSRLSPRRRAGTLATKTGAPRPAAELLAANIRLVLEEAIAAGGSTLRDHRLTDGTLGYFQHNFRVYDREGETCSTAGCTGHIRRIVQSGRSTFYCSACQK
jgi:formamidopyrimidine-DNA glycosylase